MHIHHSDERGFTLVEMIVAVGLFAVVMVICVSTLFALVNANRKAQALQSVMNNLNISLDGMARSIRQGNTYHCGTTLPITSTHDCPTDGDNSQIAFEHYGGNSGSAADQWIYRFNNSTHQIEKSIDSGTTFYAITAPEVGIDDMRFYVVGTDRNGTDTAQPRVVIVIKGTAAANNSRTKSTFHIQVGATQRLIDL